MPDTETVVAAKSLPAAPELQDPSLQSLRRSCQRKQPYLTKAETAWLYVAFPCSPGIRHSLGKTSQGSADSCASPWMPSSAAAACRGSRSSGSCSSYSLPLSVHLLQDSQPSTQGCSLSPERCPQHGLSSEIAAGKSGSGRGAEPCPWAEDQECLFPIQHAKAPSPAKPQCLFLPLASKGWQQKHVRGRRSSVKEGSGFLLGLCDLFWFGKNRDVQRCSKCTARLFPLPQQQNKPCGLLQSQEIGAQSHSPAFGCWGGTRNPAPGSRCLCLFARKIYVQPWNLTMGALSSSPASLGCSSCCGMGTIFLQLAAAEPSCLGVHGLGVMSAMPLATRIPLTLLTSLLREASTEKELLGQSQEKG